MWGEGGGGGGACETRLEIEPTKDPDLVEGVIAVRADQRVEASLGSGVRVELKCQRRRRIRVARKRPVRGEQPLIEPPRGRFRAGRSPTLLECFIKQREFGELRLQVRVAVVQKVEVCVRLCASALGCAVIRGSTVHVLRVGEWGRAAATSPVPS